MENDTVQEKIPMNNDETNDSKDEKTPESKYFWSNITLEPLWFGTMFVMAIDIVIYKNIYIERTCIVDLGYSGNFCDVLSALNSSIEKEAQRVVSSVFATSGVITGFISCVTVIFLGPWSDSSGRRKPLLLLSSVASLISTIGFLVTLSLPNLSVAWVIYVKSLPLSIGGFLTMMAGYSYLGDICYKTKRCATIVMGRNGFSMFLSFVIGSFVSPLVYRQIGFMGTVCLSFILQIYSFLFVYFKVQDLNVAEKIPSIFDITLPMKAFQCLTKKREGYKRTIIFVMMIVPAANTVIGANEMSIRYLYLRNTFSWTEKDYGYIITLRQFINSMGILVMINVFKKILKLRDEVVGLIGGMSELVDAVVFMCINKTWMLYATALFGILSSAPIIVERPIVNKFIDQYEQGKIYSIIAILEMVASFSTVPVSNFVYSQTLSTYPSCFLIISILGAAVTIIAYLFVIKLCQMETKRLEESVEKTAKLDQM